MLMLFNNVVFIFIYDCLFQVRSLQKASNTVALDGASYKSHFMEVSFCVFAASERM